MLELISIITIFGFPLKTSHTRKSSESMSIDKMSQFCSNLFLIMEFKSFGPCICETYSFERVTKG